MIWHWKLRYIGASVEPFKTRLFDSVYLKGQSREPSSRRVLCIVFHGKGDSLEAFRDISREIGIPSIDYLLLNGPMKFADGFKWINDEPRHELSLAILRDQLFALIEELKQIGFRTENIVLLGHSQGGRVASDLVMNSPYCFRAVVAVSSYVGFFRGWNLPQARQETGAWRTPWLFTHGTYDRVIRLREIRQDIRELSRGRIPLTYKEFRKGHDFDHDSELPYIRDWLSAIAAKRIAAKRPIRRIEKSERKISEGRDQYRQPNR
jgi:phospholipase/carboxylesterase